MQRKNVRLKHGTDVLTSRLTMHLLYIEPLRTIVRGYWETFRRYVGQKHGPPIRLLGSSKHWRQRPRWLDFLKSPSYSKYDLNSHEACLRS